MHCGSRPRRAVRTSTRAPSASTLLERADSAGASYLDLAQLISDHGAQSAIREDLEQLFRRAIFNILVGNRDDHLRNHGFIRVPTGWRLAPAYDMNPNPFRNDHVLTFDGHLATPDVSIVLETADLYRLSKQHAQSVIDEVRGVVAMWRDEARRAGLAGDELTRMESVFMS